MTDDGKVAILGVDKFDREVMRFNISTSTDGMARLACAGHNADQKS